MPITSDQVLSCLSNLDNAEFIQRTAVSPFIEKHLLNRVHGEDFIPESELWTIHSISINSWNGIRKVDYPGKVSLWAVAFDGSYFSTKPGLNQLFKPPQPFEDHSKISGEVCVDISMDTDGSPRLAAAQCVRCVRKS